MFKPVTPQVDFIALEHEILDFWKRTNAFEKRRAMNQGGPKWSFIDGPITANNPMGVHHAWGRTYKDVFHRYWAMKGHDTRYQNGFDCQGLWVEVEVEKELGFKSKRDIEAFGVAEFVNLCKRRVLKYAARQTEQSIRLGYWMDWNDPNFLRDLEQKMAEDPQQVITVEGPNGPVTDTVEQIVGRLGMPELGGSYFTFSNENNYTIWAMLKKCHQHGWIYKGTDVMPWCPRCGTGISQHEIVTEGYQELTHTSIFLRFPLRDRPGESLLVWTTTPWTLTSNVAAAVHPELTYALVEQDGQRLWLAKETIPSAIQGDYRILEERLGRELEGWRYDGPFDELPAQQKPDPHAGVSSVEAHRVIIWDEVSATEGTGIVHIAPGCGAEDFALSKAHNLPVIAPLNEEGIYLDGFGWLTGRDVTTVAEPIFDDLKRKGLLHRLEDYTHRYPVCWRCGTELVFRLVDEWFISMGEQLDKPFEELTEEEKERNLRYQIMEVVMNETQWYPAFGLERELDWLRNMHDWMISKKRYWGLALPIWECHECGHFEVIGSEEELREKAVEGWEEFEGHTPHRPWIDAVKIRCPKCGATISRIPDVGNPWLDAGIVSFSTLQYRTNRAYWEQWFPADLISESFPGQFRNWFYSLLAMSTVMERRSPFRFCYTYGTLLAEDGRPMHKSWGNAIWFDDAAEQMGVDVMRWLYCAHKPEQDLLFGYGRADETRRRFLIPLWNVYSFFVTYANLDEWAPNNPNAPEPAYTLLDRWILARLHQLIAFATERMDAYDPFPDIPQAVERFVDDLSNWYIRRSRRRFWRSEADSDKEAAYRTLYTVLTTLVKLLAPYIPFVTEAMYQNLVRSVDQDTPESVHHNDWPTADPAMIDEELIADMDLAITVTGLGRAARSNANIKLRQPLARAIIVASSAAQERLRRTIDLITDELNVKEVELTAEAEDLVHYEVALKPQILGPKHGPLFPKLRQAVQAMDQADLARKLNAGQSVTIPVDGQAIELLPEEADIRVRARSGYAVAEAQGSALAEAAGVVVGIDTELTPELKREGLARDFIRQVQTLRKEAGLEISDRIHLTWQGGDQLRAALADFASLVAEETLAQSITEGHPPDQAATKQVRLDGEQVTIAIQKATP